MGLGVAYSKEELAVEFPMQVLETPVSELAISGMAVGLASQGFRPVVVHGRVEFALLAMDQILTQASRWDFMFGGDYSCPVIPLDAKVVRRYRRFDPCRVAQTPTAESRRPRHHQRSRMDTDPDKPARLPLERAL